MWKKFIITFAIFIAFQTTAEPAIRIISVAIPGMVNNDGSGSYIQLVRRALEVRNIKFDVLPPKRASIDFSRAMKSTCMMPLNQITAISLGIETNGKIFSESFNSSYATILSPRGMSPIHSLQAIKGKVVGVLLGFPVADEVIENAKKIERPSSMVALLKMLELGRIDFAYVHFPDALMKNPQINMSELPKSKLKFQIVSEAMACTSDMQAIINDFNNEIDQIYKDESIKNILGPAYTGR